MSVVGHGFCLCVLAVAACDGSGMDGLGRPTLKTYSAAGGASATERVVYCYDGQTAVRESSPMRVTCAGSDVQVELGQMTGAGTLDSRTEYQHDPVGRLARRTQKTEGLSVDPYLDYQYWSSDAVKQTRYPSARQVVELVYADVDTALWPAAEWSVAAQLRYLRT